MDGTFPAVSFPVTGDFLAGRLRDQFDPSDLMVIERAMGQPRALGDADCLIARGEVARHATILLDGFMFSRINRSGKRHIVGVFVPGDFVDLHGFALKRLDHDVVAAGPVRIAQTDRDTLRNVTEQHPPLARALWFSTLLDAAIHRQWISNFEVLDAPQRIAHLYAELRHRLQLIGRKVDRVLRTPFTQSDLADMCGVSAIHANRALARIRDLGLGQTRRGDFYADDWAALETYAHFRPDYLYANRLRT